MYLDRTVYIYCTYMFNHTHTYICTYIYTIFVIMYVAICCMYMLCFHGEPHKMGSIPKILWHPWWVSHRRAQDLACWDSPIRLGLTYLGEFRFFTGEDYMIRFDRFHWEILEWHDEFGEDFMIFEINGQTPRTPVFWAVGFPSFKEATKIGWTRQQYAENDLILLKTRALFFRPRECCSGYLI